MAVACRSSGHMYRSSLWFKSPGVSMKPFPGCRYLIGVNSKPTK